MKKSYIMLCALIFVSMDAKMSPIKITKAFHHKGTMSDKLVFYFSKRPICNYMPSAQATGTHGQEVPVNANGQIELEFFMPITQAEKQAQKFFSQLNATDNDLYRVAFEQDYAKGGLTCRVLFRPEEIGFHQESFEAINGQQALAFSFLKRNAMKTINDRMKPLRRSAQVKKKSTLQLIAAMGDVIQVL